MKLTKMKKYLVLIAIFIITNLCHSQQTKFLVVSNPSIADVKNISLLDSLIKKVNSVEEINFIIFTGNLTSKGTEKQFLLLKSYLERLSKPYFLLPGLKDVRDANGWFFYKDIFEDKFTFELNGFAFIGLSSAVPLMNLNHYTIENIDWLNSVLDAITLNKELFLFSNEVIDERVDNWKYLLHPLSIKNLKLIINTAAKKNQLRNLLGFSVIDIYGSLQYEQNIFNYSLFEISKDSIRVSDSNNKIWAVFDKSIQIEKEKFELDDLQTFSSEIVMRKDLSATTLTSTTYWNQKLYAFDESGLISCLDTTGKFLWDYDTNGNIYGKPVIADRMLAAATIQGDIITLSAISGEQIQSIGFEERITSDLIVINYSGDRELMIPKLTNSKSAIVFGTSGGKVFCYDLETLQEYWVNKSSKEMIRSTPITIENKILYTSHDGYIYCIDARNGSMIWRWKEKSETDFSDACLQYDGKKIFAVSSDGILYAIDFLLGKLVWKFDKVNFIQSLGLSRDKKHIYAASKDKLFIILNSEKGTIEREIKWNDIFVESLAQPIDREKRIIFENKGNVYSFDEKFNETKILFLGNAAIHPITQIAENKFLISNIDGRIVIFALR